ncbi:hypothetical protein KHA80_09020 [Anaerobacillus sp. HL2]|nr:hypothetical protein KHA80_09020 [Anaerobacillus sp. HL2]
MSVRMTKQVKRITVHKKQMSLLLMLLKRHLKCWIILPYFTDNDLMKNYRVEIKEPFTKDFEG